MPCGRRAIPPLILPGEGPDRLVCLEGHPRLTAYALIGFPADLECLGRHCARYDALGALTVARTSFIWGFQRRSPGAVPIQRNGAASIRAARFVLCIPGGVLPRLLTTVRALGCTREQACFCLHFARNSHQTSRTEIEPGRPDRM